MDIPLGLFAQLGGAGLGWALLGYAIHMILTGKLVPGSLYQEAREAAKTWQQAWEAERTKNERLLVPVAQAQRDFIRALPAQQEIEREAPGEVRSP